MRHIIALLFFSAVLPAQTPAPIVSPEVHPDHRVTFRFRAPNANSVGVALEGSPRIEMQKGENGLWSATTSALEPDLYGYSFVADGVSLIDPSNPVMKPNLLNTQSLVHIPGPPSLPWEVRDVPRGTVHRHFYKSAIVGDQRDFYVYTPPGYEQSRDDSYPALFLLHGYSDDASGWTTVGRAHVIMDNLIADGKAKPMLIVMPLGYGAPEVVSARGPLRDPGLWQRNVENFAKVTVGEVLPLVERTYRAARDRNLRAIAGLSMGGTESLVTGLNTLDRFAWIGAFSSGGLPEKLDGSFPRLDARANDQLRLLWIACGKEDRLIEANLKLLAWLKSKGVRYSWTETPGAHTWRVWRRYLAEFAPLLFR